ncbi:MAG: hypothetical protein QOA70_06755 [Nitrososphaeraceae archaeon]|nr:hypothetical protein [Nitrososphaeraceae archaeon]
MDIKKIFDWWAGGVGYSSEAQAVFNNMPDDISSSMKVLIANLVDTSNWTNVNDLVYYGLNTEPNSLAGWKGNVTSTLYNSYWFVHSNCETTGESGSYIDSGFIPSILFSLNSSGFGVYIKENRNFINSLFGVIDGAGKGFELTQTGISLSFKANSDTALTDSTQTVFSNYSLYCVERTGSGTVRLIRNGAVIATASDSSNSLATISIFLGAINSNGSATTFLEARYRLAFSYDPTGFDHATWYNGILTFNSGIDALIPFIPFGIDEGQSNSQGRAIVTRMLGLTSYSDKPKSSRVFSKRVFRTAFNSGKWVQLRAGINTSETVNNPSGTFGGEVSFCTLIFNRLGNAPVYYLKIGEGGNGLYLDVTENDLNPGSVNETFDRGSNFIQKSLDRIREEYPGKLIQAFVSFHQGENDVSVPLTKLPAYPANIITFFNAFRAIDPLLSSCLVMLTKLNFAQSADETTLNGYLLDYKNANSNVILMDVVVAYPRKMDLPLGIRTTYPSVIADDNHNSYEFQIEKGVLGDAQLQVINYYSATGSHPSVTFSVSPSAGTIIEESFIITCQLSSNGTVYSVVVPRDQTQPLPINIKYGRNYLNRHAISALTAVDSGSGVSLEFKWGLQSATNYDVYVIGISTLGSQTSVTKVQITTATASWSPKDFGSDTVLWVNPSDTSSMFKERVIPITKSTVDTDPVGFMYEQGYHGLKLQTESADTRRPLLKTDSSRSYLEFDGSLMYMRLLSSQKYLSLLHAASPVWGIMFWIKMPIGTYGGNHVICDSNAGASTNAGIRITRDSANKIALRVLKAVSGQNVCNPDSTATLTVASGWTSVIIYLNGIGASAGTMIIGNNTPQTFNVSAGVVAQANSDLYFLSNNATTTQYKGWINDFTIIKRIPTAQEITNYKAYSPSRKGYNFKAIATSEFDMDDGTKIFSDTARTTPIVDGATVAIVDNKIATIFGDLDRYLTQSTAGLRPAWRDNDLNGYSTIEFDGTDSMTFNISNEAGGAWSILIVVKNDDSVNGSDIFNASGVKLRISGSSNSTANSNVDGQSYLSVVSSDNSNVNIAPKSVSEGYNTILIIRDGNKMYMMNGLKEYAEGTITGSFSFTNTGSSSDAGYELDGKIAYFKKWSGAMSLSEAESIIDAANTKYIV